MVKFVLFVALACLAISLVAAKSLDGSSKGARIIQGFPAAINQFPPPGIFEVGWLKRKVSANVRLGSNRFESPQVQMDSDDFIIYEKFNPLNLNNDIALVDLGADVRLSDGIRPIRLPTKSQASELFVDQTVTVSGWGSTTDSSQPSFPSLSFVNMNVITNKRCEEFFTSKFITNSTICAVGFHSPAQGVCRGDYGGPVIVRETDNKDTLVGVVSPIHSAVCDEDSPSGFARTTMFIDWIAEKTGIEVRP